VPTTEYSARSARLYVKQQVLFITARTIDKNREFCTTVLYNDTTQSYKTRWLAEYCDNYHLLFDDLHTCLPKWLFSNRALCCEACDCPHAYLNALIQLFAAHVPDALVRYHLSFSLHNDSHASAEYDNWTQFKQTSATKCQTSHVWKMTKIYMSTACRITTAAEIQTKLDGYIVWNARNTVFGSKRLAICARADYFVHSTKSSVKWLNSRW